MKIEVRPTESSDRDWVLKLVQSWGGDFIVSRGRKLYPANLPGFCAVKDGGERVGLTTYEIVGDQCELVTLDALTKFEGIGTLLTNSVIDAARNAGCKRLWLITLNDNLDAIRFYQKRGFHFAAVHAGALELSRKIKPKIAKTGNFGIELRDELEFETIL